MVVMMLLILASLGMLVLGFSWLFGSNRPGGGSPPAAATPTGQPAPAGGATPTVPAVAPRPTATAAVVATATQRPTATPSPQPTAPPTRPTAPTAPPTSVPPTAVRIAVPQLIGLIQAAAQQQVAARGLTLDVRDGYDPSKADTLILDQDPKEGASVPPGSKIRVVVNRPNRVAVPNVQGLEEPAARKTLSDAGLKVRVERDSGRRQGVVGDQSPQPGVRVDPGTQVTIIIGS
jgi:serine/threonine-protein kinase